MASMTQTTTVSSGSSRQHMEALAAVHGLEGTLQASRRATTRAVLAPFLTVALALGLWVAAVTEVAAPLGETLARLDPRPPAGPARTVTTCERQSPRAVMTDRPHGCRLR
jgi:hypothetical protein